MGGHKTDMRIVINTNYKAAGTIVLEGIAKRISEVVRNDWDHYENFDVAIFMAPDSQVCAAKKSNPKILAGIFDPKVSKPRQRDEARVADFLIVSSIEQRDFFLKYNKNVFVYYMFPDIALFEKAHSTSLGRRLVVGYHGNKQHLDAMADVSWALDEIAKTREIELRAIYNIEKLGKWTQNVPQVCPVTHVQWGEAKFLEDLKECDIGIAPGAIPAPNLFARPLASFFHNPVSYNPNDYLVRFKMSNNPGRLYVFSQIGIPVVTDFTPSAGQMIQDGVSGRLVGTKEGWKQALEELIESVEKRNVYAKNLKNFISENHSVEKNFEKFMSFLQNLHAK